MELIPALPSEKQCLIVMLLNNWWWERNRVREGDAEGTIRNWHGSFDGKQWNLEIYSSHTLKADVTS